MSKRSLARVVDEQVLGVVDHQESWFAGEQLGERSGPQSIGNGFTLQEATEYRMEEHLRACGCDWLRQVAAEERLSGRIFTPEEILAFRPTPEMLARLTVLLERSHSGLLTFAEQAELDEFERIEHVVVLLKAGSLPHLTSQP